MNSGDDMQYRRAIVGRKSTNWKDAYVSDSESWKDLHYRILQIYTQQRD